MVADADKARTLWVHPEDAALLADCPLTLAVESDPAMMRGTVRLETSTGWIEHGRAVYLDELRTALGEAA
jgi:flagellar assembly protein FliH